MSVSAIVLYVLAAFFAIISLVAEYRRVVMMMQQNSYRTERYMRWLRSSGDSTSYARIVAMMVFLGALASFSNEIWGELLIVLFSVGSAIALFRRKYKKPLVVTARVRRIFFVMALVSVAVLALSFVWAWLSDCSLLSAVFYSTIALVALYCGSHIVIMTSVWMLSPVEKSINARYYREAAEILRSMRALKVVGITGSYGKTSTKHYLQRILAEQFEVLMTPGSYNTTLGVIRTVREMMKPYCEVFICEMGAKQPGDIKEICELVKPQVGIVTSVGPQHLESFKTIDNVQRTKFELVDALPESGFAIVNNDFPMIASRKVDDVECLRYGVTDEKAQVRASEISYSTNGTDFTMICPDGSFRFHTRLVGECNVSNLLAAIACAIHLGVPMEKIRRAVERIEPVEHRLSMKRTPGGYTIIDDAFNSNPTGSTMALEVLRAMTGGKRIVVTPGMIELGDQQYELNHRFGQLIAESVDVAIVVGEYNREAITGGISSVEASGIKLICAATFADAQRELTSILCPGDTVLYENDLPDTFK